MAYDVEKLHKMENALSTTANLVGNDSGLSLDNESKICLDAFESIKEGIFKTVIMGTFKNGKSSTINALLGQKVLPEAVTPATAIISCIRNGKDDDVVYVYFKDKTIKEEHLSKEDFFKKYKFTSEDAEECKRTGNVKRFSNVDYSVVYSDIQLLKNGVQIFDTPGLEDKACATEVALKAASTANAIIYTLSATAGGFSMNDVIFFRSNFDGRHLNNVFFVINKVDLLSEPEVDEIKQYVKSQLTDVFKNDGGDFDEDLYMKRVFFVSAKNALQQKTGGTCSTVGVDEFLRFERELENFLTTDARSIAIFNSCFSKIANAYIAAEHKSQVYNKILEEGVDEIEISVSNAQNILSSSENELENLKRTFELAKAKTSHIVSYCLTEAVNGIDQTWEAELNRIIDESGFKVTDLLKLAWQAVRYIGNHDQKEAAFADVIKPITDGVEKSVSRQIEDAIDAIKVKCQPIIQELSKEVDGFGNRIDVNFTEIYQLFRPNGQGDENIQRGNVNIFKTILAGFNGDPSVMVELMAGNDMGWADFIKKSLIEMGSDFILLSVVGGPIGLALFILKEWWQLKNGQQEMLEGLASKSKEDVMRSLRTKITEQRDEIDMTISSQFDLCFNSISVGVKAKIEEERKILDETTRNLGNAQFEYSKEVERCHGILNHIFESSKEAYDYIFAPDSNISLQEFIRLSNA